MNTVKGFKIFNPDWTCRDKKYTCPGIFEENVKPDLCARGMHFCERLVDCLNYYPEANGDYHAAEVIAHGDVVRGSDKCCTNKLEIVREIPWSEVWQMVNTGNCNTGDCNTGNWNTGDWNTGDWNTSSFNNGCFMTIEPKIPLFNKPSDWTYLIWYNSRARAILNDMPQKIDLIDWVRESDMTDAEKEEYPPYKTTGGYIKVTKSNADKQKWWDELSEDDKAEVKSLPNFDAEIFKECTGIEVKE